MIYVDTSIVLAEMLGEDRLAPDWLWSEALVASRLLEYEIWTRLHAHGLAERVAEDVAKVLGTIMLVEMIPPVLERALSPFSIPLRTLDALHLATAYYVHTRRGPVRLASFDRRMNEAGQALGLTLVDLS